jgi:hypothetical protein
LDEVMAMPFHISSPISLPWINGVLYLDPGTGSVILQAVIAVFMSVLFFIGLFRKRLAALLSRLFRNPSADSPKSSGRPDDE